MGDSTWTKLPAINEVVQPCLCCPPRLPKADLKMSISIGMGSAYVTKDDKQVYDGETAFQAGKRPLTLQAFENRARKDPDHDWRVYIMGPMYEVEYQRQGEDTWVLVRRGDGFA